MNTDLEQALLCQYVYNNKPDGEAKEIEYVIRGDVAALRGSGKDRGKHGWVGYVQDWIRNLRFFPWYSKEVGWHPVGFLKAGIAIADRLEGTKVHCLTAHSLGAVVAQIAAAALVKRGHLILSVVVFGSPKCGQLPMLDKIDVTLYVANNDRVTDMPPWYKPIREVTRIDSEGHSLSGYIQALEGEQSD